MSEETEISTIKTRTVDIPTDVLNQRMKIADQLYRANCFGSDVKNKEQAFVKILAGAEMGMPAIESMNSLYIVNGKITIWGAALSSRLRKNGWAIEYEENGVDSCTVKIKKDDEAFEYTATKEDLQALNSQAYKKSPKDKLKWHALSRLVRFYVPEILGGQVTYTTEEYEDVKVRKLDDVVNTSTSEILGKIENASSEADLKLLEVEIANFAKTADKDELRLISDALNASRLNISAVDVEDEGVSTNHEVLKEDPKQPNKITPKTDATNN